MPSSRAGRFVSQRRGQEGFAAFIPAPLPPQPPLVMDTRMEEALEGASHALGKLDGVTLMLPDPALFLYSYIRKEAVLSSQIEGTQSTLSDLLLFESAAVPGAPTDDVREVSNYVAAINHGLARIRKQDFPLVLRLVREMHALLLKDDRGASKDPGEFRRSQNWLGGTGPGNARYVPPPPQELLPALDNLEKFINDQFGRTPPLLKAGFAHAQFETIHPFLDGNGRLGRLLITLILCSEGVLERPLLYLSLYLKVHRDEYYETLQRIRTEGDWEGWFYFFLTGVREVAEQATIATKKIVELFNKDRDVILRGKRAASAARVHELLCHRAILSIPKAASILHISQPTVTAAIRRLEDVGIVREATGRQWGRQFVYTRYLALLNQGIE
ncbi:MAG: Fic family protein [Candidatus Eiseniibacteriota bacterium]